MTTSTTPGRALATWWAQQLGAPTFRATGEHSSPEDHLAMGVAGALATMLADRTTVTAEQAQKFVDVLTEKVDASLDLGTYGVHLSVDYHPDLMLTEAAEAADVSSNRFPWKTHTFACHDYVIVAPGYGAPHTLIWTAPDWERPACQSRRYTDDWSSRLPEVCGLLQFHEEPQHGSWIPRAVDA